MEMTELEEYQEFVTKCSPNWLDYCDNEYELVWAAMELNSEAGEVLGAVTKMVRKDQKIEDDLHDKIVDELGDTLWGVAAVANAIGVSLDDVIIHNIDKLNQRYAAKTD